MKKITRITLIIALILFTILLSSCGFRQFRIKQAYNKLLQINNFDYVEEDLNLPDSIDDVSITYISLDTNILTHDGKITRTEENQDVTLIATFTYKDTSMPYDIKVIIIREILVFANPFIPDVIELLQTKMAEDADFLIGMPAMGEVKALVIPIDFVGHRFTKHDINRLNKAFFGEESDTGWESVTTYYKKSSYGNLNITGTITNVYNSYRRASYFTDLYNSGEDADYILVKEALTYLDPQIDFSEYDSNKDGYIDALYFIYSTPVYYGDLNPFDRNQSELWWAYVYQYYTEDYEYYDGVEVNYFLWAGYEFIDEAFKYDNYNDYYIDINAATYIHETGHLLGLEDYYDYNEKAGPKGGLGGADMMDNTVGDHSSLSKILLGWTKPYIASNADFEIKIRPFEKYGDVILVTPKWTDSYFSEFFLIDYYTPTGLNAAHSGFNGLFSKSGIRIYHVNSIIDPKVGKPKNKNGYYSMFSYNNSDTEIRLITLIEADANNSIENTQIAKDSDLFQVGQIFGVTKYKDYKLHSGNTINFTIQIVSITPNEAIIRILFN